MPGLAKPGGSPEAFRLPPLNLPNQRVASCWSSGMNSLVLENRASRLASQCDIKASKPRASGSAGIN